MYHEPPKVTVIGLYGISFFFAVERFPAGGETVVSSHFHTEPGGKGFNQAVAAARLGASVHYVTALGDDAHGRQCSEYLAAEGIYSAYAATCNLPTASAAILYDREGDSQVIVYPGASRGLTREDIRKNRDAIAESDFLMVQNEMPPETLHAAVEVAGEAGVPVLFNPAPAGRLGPELLRKVYAVVPNEGEAVQITGLPWETPPEMLAEALHDMGAQRAVITLGEKGALVSEAGHTTWVDPLPVPAVDTTGAGDTFNAALAVSLARGWELLTAARYATVAAGLAVTKRGVLAALPYRCEVDEAYQRFVVDPGAN